MNVYFTFFILIIKNPIVFYTHSIFQFTFQGLKSYMWLMATVLDSASLTARE